MGAEQSRYSDVFNEGAFEQEQKVEEWTKILLPDNPGLKSRLLGGCGPTTSLALGLSAYRMGIMAPPVWGS